MPALLFFSILLELEVRPLERDGVVEEELRRAVEFARDCFQGEVPMEGVQEIGEHEGNVGYQGFWRYSG